MNKFVKKELIGHLVTMVILWVIILGVNYIDGNPLKDDDSFWSMAITFTLVSPYYYYQGMKEGLRLDSLDSE